MLGMNMAVTPSQGRGNRLHVRSQAAVERGSRKEDVALTCSKLHSCPKAVAMSSVLVLRDWEVGCQ